MTAYAGPYYLSKANVIKTASEVSHLRSAIKPLILAICIGTMSAVIMGIVLYIGVPLSIIVAPISEPLNWVIKTSFDAMLVGTVVTSLVMYLLSVLILGEYYRSKLSSLLVSAVINPLPWAVLYLTV